MEHMDPHQRPPESIKNVYKKYQKMKLKDLDRDPDILDLSNEPPTSAKSKLRVVEEWRGEDLTAIFRAFGGQDADMDDEVPERVLVFEHEDMPGLHIIPSLLPPSLQLTLLSRLLHRDLSNPTHLTNIHTHYTLSYPPPSTPSFFTTPPTSSTPIAHPLDPTIHRPLSTPQLLNKKLRWTTLGGQYDWTLKRYPSSPPPPFPSDVKNLLEAIYPHTRAEAAIVNLYSPGDTLSVHRDVAEVSGRGLVSVSLGCEGVFVIGVSKPSLEGSVTSSSTTTSTVGEEEIKKEQEGQDAKILTLRLKSGSAVYMSGDSRFAWHGVPQIVAGTCPGYLADWPARGGWVGEGGGSSVNKEVGEGGVNKEEGEGETEKDPYEAWRGWMAGKRVNLNVRQMWD